MTALIWMLTWLPQVLPAMSELLLPVDVKLTSSNFNHVLKWAAAPGTPTGVYYHVAFNTNTGVSFVPVAGCEHVQHPLVCNLTEAFSDPTKIYITQITAHLEAQTSKPYYHPEFQATKDTDLDLPLVNVKPCGRNLCVDFQPHMEHLRELYDLFHYQLKIMSSDTDRPQLLETKSLKREIVKDLAPGRNYCISIRFFDDMVPRKSNFSQHRCAFTAGVYTADTLISGVLMFLVMCAVVVLVLLIYTGFIFLKRRPLPPVLTSIHHIEQLQVVVPWRAYLSSLMNLKALPPSSGGKRSSQTSSDDSDGETEAESTAESKGAGYKLRLGTNLLSASSSSSSSLSAPLSLQPVVPPSCSSNPNAVFLPPDFFSPQPEAQISAAGLKHAASLPESPPEPQQRPPADAGSLTATDRVEPKRQVGGHDVNLLTLTFGRREEKEEQKKEEETSRLCEVEPESPSAILILPSQTVDTVEVAIETVSCCSVVEEEEEEEEEAELSAYMRRPAGLQNLL